MSRTRKAILSLLSIASVSWMLPARADSPALYWYRKPVDYTVSACFDQAETSLKRQRLQDIAVSKADVFGRTDNSSVAVTCFKAGRDTMVFIMVTGSDGAEVKDLYENIRKDF